MNIYKKQPLKYDRTKTFITALSSTASIILRSRRRGGEQLSERPRLAPC